MSWTLVSSQTASSSGTIQLTTIAAHNLIVIGVIFGNNATNGAQINDGTNMFTMGSLCATGSYSVQLGYLLSSTATGTVTYTVQVPPGVGGTNNTPTYIMAYAFSNSSGYAAFDAQPTVGTGSSTTLATGTFNTSADALVFGVGWVPNNSLASPLVGGSAATGDITVSSSNMMWYSNGQSSKSGITCAATASPSATWLIAGLSFKGSASAPTAAPAYFTCATSTNNSGSTTIALSGIQTGDCIVLCASWTGTSATGLTSISDATSSFILGTVESSGSYYPTQIGYLASSVATGSVTYTVTFPTGASSPLLQVYAFRTAVASNGFVYDTQACGTGSTATLVTPSFNTAGTSEIVVACGRCPSNTIAAGFVASFYEDAFTSPGSGSFSCWWNWLGQTTSSITVQASTAAAAWSANSVCLKLQITNINIPVMTDTISDLLDPFSIPWPPSGTQSSVALSWAISKSDTIKDLLDPFSIPWPPSGTQSSVALSWAISKSDTIKDLLDPFSIPWPPSGTQSSVALSWAIALTDTIKDLLDPFTQTGLNMDINAPSMSDTIASMSESQLTAFIFNLLATDTLQYMADSISTPLLDLLQSITETLQSLSDAITLNMDINAPSMSDTIASMSESQLTAFIFNMLLTDTLQQMADSNSMNEWINMPSMSDTIQSLNETNLTAFIFNMLLSDTLQTMADSNSINEWINMPTMIDTISSLNESNLTAFIFNMLLTDTLQNMADSNSMNQWLNLPSLTDTIQSLNETNLTAFIFNMLLTDTIQYVADSNSVNEWLNLPTMTDTISDLLDPITQTGLNMWINLPSMSDTISSFNETNLTAFIFNMLLTDTVQAFNDTNLTAFVFNMLLTDTLQTMSDSSLTAFIFNLLESDTFTANESNLTAFIFNLLKSDTFTVNDTNLTAFIFNMLLTDTTTFSETQQTIFNALVSTLIETMTLNETQLSVLNPLLIPVLQETITFSESIGNIYAAVIWSITVSDTLSSLNEAITIQFDRLVISLLDTLIFNETSTNILNPLVYTAQDTVTVNETQQSIFDSFVVHGTDTLQTMQDIQLAGFIFNMLLSDTLQNMADSISKPLLDLLLPLITDTLQNMADSRSVNEWLNLPSMTDTIQSFNETNLAAFIFNMLLSDTLQNMADSRSVNEWLNLPSMTDTIQSFNETNLTAFIFNMLLSDTLQTMKDFISTPLLDILLPTMTDTTTWNETQLTAFIFNLLKSDTFTANETFLFGEIIELLMTDTFTANETQLAAFIFNLLAVDTLTLNDLILGNTDLNKILSDEMTLNETQLSTLSLFLIATTDTATYNDTNAYALSLALALIDTLELADSSVMGLNPFVVFPTDAFMAADLPYQFGLSRLPLTVTDTFTLSDLQQIGFNILYLVATDTITLNDAIERIYAAVIWNIVAGDTMTATDVFVQGRFDRLIIQVLENALFAEEPLLAADIALRLFDTLFSSETYASVMDICLSMFDTASANEALTTMLGLFRIIAQDTFTAYERAEFVHDLMIFWAREDISFKEKIRVLWYDVFLSIIRTDSIKTISDRQRTALDRFFVSETDAFEISDSMRALFAHYLVHGTEVLTIFESRQTILNKLHIVAQENFLTNDEFEALYALLIVLHESMGYKESFQTLFDRLTVRVTDRALLAETVSEMFDVFAIQSQESLSLQDQILLLSIVSMIVKQHKNKGRRVLEFKRRQYEYVFEY